MPNDRDTTTATRAAFEAWVNRTSTGEPDFQSAAAMWAWAAWQAALAAAPSPVPAQEPVAWQIREKHRGLHWRDWEAVTPDWIDGAHRWAAANPANREIRALFAAPAPAGQAEDAAPEMYVHHRTGGQYRKLGEAELQTDLPLSDMARVVVYQGEDGRLWVRERIEFIGRFVQMQAVQPQPGDANHG